VTKHSRQCKSQSVCSVILLQKPVKLINQFSVQSTKMIINTELCQVLHVANESLEHLTSYYTKLVTSTTM